MHLQTARCLTGCRPNLTALGNIRNEEEKKMSKHQNCDEIWLTETRCRNVYYCHLNDHFLFRLLQGKQKKRHNVVNYLQCRRKGSYEVEQLS